MILNNTQVLKKVDNRLNLLLQNDQAFRMEFEEIKVFYTRKFINIINDSDRKLFNNWLQKSMNEQFQNGYLMVEQYYNDKSAYIDESLYKLPEGIFTENTPPILLEMLHPLLEQELSLDEIIDTDTTHELILWSMQNYEEIRPLLKQISFDLSCLGARQALRDKRSEFEFKTIDLDTEERKLGNIGDLQFLNPQMYLKINHVSPNVEYWDIHYWSSNLNNISKIGEALVISEPEYLNTKIKISYHLSMLSSIPNDEITGVANNHINKLMNYSEKNEIQYHLTIVQDFLTDI